MSNSLSYKSKQFFWLLIKLSIVIGCGYFIWQKLTSNNNFTFSDFYQKLTKNNVFSLKNIIILVFLSFLNHFIEILKWKKLASFCKNISTKNATIQSLASLTASLITPNRIGEYGAKVLYFDKKYRKQIFGVNLIGNLHQMLITTIFGVIGFGYFIYLHNISIEYTQLEIIKFVVFGLFLVFAVLFITKYLKKVNSYLIFINTIPLSLHLKTAFLSFLRFVIFSHQFYFLLLIFKVDISYITAISGITTVYFISSLIPMLSLFDVVLKGTVAVWVFSFYTIEPALIVTITTFMWVLNFVFPAILGSYFVLTFKPTFAK